MFHDPQLASNPARSRRCDHPISEIVCLALVLCLASATSRRGGIAAAAPLNDAWRGSTPDAIAALAVAPVTGRLAVAYGSSVLVGDDDGNTWQPTTSVPALGTVRDLFASRTGNVFALACNGVFRLPDGALTWTRVTAKFVSQVAEDAGGAVLAYATGSSLYRSVDGGISWTLLTGAVPSSAVSGLAAVNRDTFLIAVYGF